MDVNTVNKKQQEKNKTFEYLLNAFMNKLSYI